MYITHAPHTTFSPNPQPVTRNPSLNLSSKLLPTLTLSREAIITKHSMDTLNDLPPDDSIFSSPIWNKGFTDPNASHVQMDPAMAMRQGQIHSTVQQIIRGISVAVFVLGIVGVGTAYMLKNTAAPTQASIDLKHALIGRVSTVMYASDSFTIISAKSEDLKITSTGITDWTILLPPSVSFTKEPTAALSTCYTIESFDKNLELAVPTSCVNFVKPGMNVIVEYLIVKPDTKTITTVKIIKEE